MILQSTLEYSDYDVLQGFKIVYQLFNPSDNKRFTYSKGKCIYQHIDYLGH